MRRYYRRARRAARTYKVGDRVRVRAGYTWDGISFEAFTGTVEAVREGRYRVVPVLSRVADDARVDWYGPDWLSPVRPRTREGA